MRDVNLSKPKPSVDRLDLVPFWYAPGGYANQCVDCEKVFLGDKRAGRCADCADARRRIPEDRE